LRGRSLQGARQLAADLSYGRKRVLEIATTLALDPKVLLLDEPMAGMGQEDVSVVSAIIRDVARDRAVLMVEHNLSVVANICQQVTVLQRGEILAEGDYATVSPTQRVRGPIWARRSLMATLLEVQGLNAWYGESHILHGVDMRVAEGETITILGRNGVGKTTTLRTITGIVRARKGKISFGGRT
jgi:ABC-type branched-subunit amino acid transport system ATPase component